MFLRNPKKFFRFISHRFASNFLLFRFNLFASKQKTLFFVILLRPFSFQKIFFHYFASTFSLQTTFFASFLQPFLLQSTFFPILLQLFCFQTLFFAISCSLFCLAFKKPVLLSSIIFMRLRILVKNLMRLRLLRLLP
jgi:hypothetical protein